LPLPRRYCDEFKKTYRCHGEFLKILPLPRRHRHCGSGGGGGSGSAALDISVIHQLI
jgi:hypothetical protein